MEDLSFTIKRRPSFLDNTGGQVSATTAVDVRDAISGCWKGYYDYLSLMEGRKDSFSVVIPDAMPQGSPGCTFSSENNVDEVGEFQFYGFVDEKGIVWFVKLYHRH